MRLRLGIALATSAACCASGGALVACFDLLHSTADVLTACELDAGHPGCAPAKIETDFCSWSPDQAKQHASDACLWLGACTAPLGNNAFGPCYFRALMAYDCKANPNHRPQREAKSLWDCLASVKSCADVAACTFHDAAPPGCEHENCALWGQSCAPGSGGACVSDSTGLSCQDASSCTRNTTLHWCVPDADGGPPVDRGIECADNGASACDGFPTTHPARWIACLPNTDAAIACTPDASAACDQGRAVMCPSGVVESLDCEALLGQGTCSPGALSPPFDWTSACSVPTSICSDDACDGGWLTSCERGTRFEVNCREQGFGDCRLLPADPGAPRRASCATSP
jgi:hypothetical protein